MYSNLWFLHVTKKFLSLKLNLVLKSALKGTTFKSRKTNLDFCLISLKSENH